MPRPQIIDGRARTLEGRAIVGPDDQCCCLPTPCFIGVQVGVNGCIIHPPGITTQAAYDTYVGGFTMQVTLPTMFNALDCCGGVGPPTCGDMDNCADLNGTAWILNYLGGSEWSYADFPNFMCFSVRRNWFASVLCTSIDPGPPVITKCRIHFNFDLVEVSIPFLTNRYIWELDVEGKVSMLNFPALIPHVSSNEEPQKTCTAPSVGPLVVSVT
jgi:hypothetical protein